MADTVRAAIADRRTMTQPSKKHGPLKLRSAGKSLAL
jgi:hypothetical protein